MHMQAKQNLKVLTIYNVNWQYIIDWVPYEGETT